MLSHTFTEVYAFLMGIGSLPPSVGAVEATAARASESQRRQQVYLCVIGPPELLPSHRCPVKTVPQPAPSQAVAPPPEAVSLMELRREWLTGVPCFWQETPGPDAFEI